MQANLGSKLIVKVTVLVISNDSPLKECHVNFLRSYQDDSDILLNLSELIIFNCGFSVKVPNFNFLENLFPKKDIKHRKEKKEKLKKGLIENFPKKLFSKRIRQFTYLWGSFKCASNCCQKSPKLCSHILHFNSSSLCSLCMCFFNCKLLTNFSSQI